MPAELSARPDIRGERIDLAWTWHGPGPRAPLRLLRRRHAFPGGPEDGLVLLDTEDLLGPAGRPWARIERGLYLADNGLAEGGLVLAEVRRYFTAPSGDLPRRLTVILHGTDGPIRQKFEPVCRLTPAEREDADGTRREGLAIFLPGIHGTPRLAARIEIRVPPTQTGRPGGFHWLPTDGAPLSVPFDRRETERIEVVPLPAPADWRRWEIRTGREGAPLRRVLLEEALAPDPNTGEWEQRCLVEDMALAGEQVRYYGLFERDNGPWSRSNVPVAEVSAMATGRYGMGERLYGLLPGLHRHYDEPDPGARGEGQLRAFLQVFGAALDRLRGGAEGLRSRHDIQEVAVERLPSLARWIGWEPDHTLDALAQRNDIGFAPKIYGRLGTAPTIRSLINRTTGWDCRVKELVHNLLLSADTGDACTDGAGARSVSTAEPIRLWEIWEQRFARGRWRTAVSRTHTDGLDGRPAIVTDGRGRSWLFWHGDRTGRRELWRLGLEGPAEDRPPFFLAPRPVESRPPEDADGPDYQDEYPTAVADGNGVRLFWTSNRGGAWSIWTRLHDRETGRAEPVTRGGGEDRNPAAVRDPEGRIWVFFQSDRRGPTDIWACRMDDEGFDAPERITGSDSKDEMPAALLDTEGHLWLFWSRDLENGRGLFARTRGDGGWGEPHPVAAGPRRDEAPTAILWQGRIRLFWHSNRTGRWQVWESTRDPGTETWSEPEPVTSHPTGDKELAALVTGRGTDAQLRLFWRSRRRGERHRSRTIDTDDAEMLAALGTHADRAHYSYDCGTPDGRGGYLLDNETRYQRGTVGLYVVPDLASEPFAMQEWERVRGFLSGFLPVNARAVFVLEPAVPEEHYESEDILEAHTDLGHLLEAETRGDVSDSGSDRIPGWRRFLTNDLGHRSVDTLDDPVEIASRTWHTGLAQGPEPD